MAGSSVTFAQKHREPKTSTKVTSSKKTASRTSVFDRLGSPTSTTQRTQDSGAALSSWRRKGPSTTIPRKQEVWQGFFVYLYRTTLTGPRWRLAWQTLPRTGGVCWATAGPPASSRTGWALHSSNGLSSPIKASVSRTRNSHQDLQQAVDDLLMKGAIEQVSDVTRLM